MSFGDPGGKGPIANLFDSTLGRLDTMFGDAMGVKKPKAPKPSALTAPVTPPSVDTPGRHKSLLGA
jgi:hypothetical protein